MALSLLMISWSVEFVAEFSIVPLGALRALRRLLDFSAAHSSSAIPSSLHDTSPSWRACDNLTTLSNGPSFPQSFHYWQKFWPRLQQAKQSSCWRWNSSLFENIPAHGSAIDAKQSGGIHLR